MTTLLDGTVRRAGDRIRITVTLVAVDDGFCLWSERYDRDVHDIFALQDEIARAVVNALEITLSSADREAAHRLSTPDLDAYDATCAAAATSSGSTSAASATRASCSSRPSPSTRRTAARMPASPTAARIST